MRDTVANPKFQLKKQIGFELEKRFPKKFIPRYSMVVFHPEIPYADARRLGQEQEKMLDILAEGITSVEQVDWAKAAEMVG
jgi:kynurenine 3-monooxygenase